MKGVLGVRVLVEAVGASGGLWGIVRRVKCMDIYEETLKPKIILRRKTMNTNMIKKACKWIFAGGCVVTLGALIEKWHREYLESVEVNRQIEETWREITERSEALDKKLADMNQKNQERLEEFNEWLTETEKWLKEQKKLDEEDEDAE